MQRKLLSLTLLTVAAVILPTQLSAQCPAIPLSVLGGTWTFNVLGLPIGAFPQANSLAVAGQFTASIGRDLAGNPLGVLTINATTALNNSFTRQETNTGRYQINETCTGGTLTMNLGSYPMQYDFWFANGGQSLNLVSTLSGKSATGTAVPGATSCPVGVALSVLAGPYALKLQTTSDNENETHGMAGRLVASPGTDLGGNALGLLTITATSNFTNPISITRLERDAGRYQINRDCTGGTLTFNLSSRPLQFEFYFRADFQELYVVSSTGLPIYGVITRAAAAPAVCPVNSLSLLNGPWTFNMQTVSDVPASTNFTVAGRWLASQSTDRNGNPVGALAINASSLFTGRLFGPSPTRQENSAGSYQVNEDCTGGTLTMNLGSFPMQYDFWFFDNNRQIYFVSTRNGVGATGSATLGVSGCPVGVSPLSLLSGTYSFRFQRVPNFAFQREAFGIAGLFSVTAPGQLAILATASLGAEGSITRLEGDAGRYQINPDCSGGSLLFNLSSRPAQYEFYFREGFQSFDVISQVGPGAYGLVTR